jgi:sarcosine oxidase subunit beta
MSPDSRPIMGTVDNVDGFILACGWSGHGFMFAPIVSRLLSELIMDGKSSISLAPWSLSIMERTLATNKSYRYLLA